MTDGHLNPSTDGPDLAGSGVGQREPVAARPTAPALAGLLMAVTEPLLTADAQPPAPGSNWAVRGWHRIRLIGGRAVDSLPKSSTTLMMVLRLLVVALVWFTIAVIAVYAAVLWACVVLPIQILTRGSKSGDLPPPPSYPPPPGVGPASAAPPLVMDPQTLAALLANAPSPNADVAVDRCPTCGGETAGAAQWCTYCGSPLPMVEKRGWHPDPIGLAALRWFDGAVWTEHARADP